jgi:hypothetical protein
MTRLFADAGDSVLLIETKSDGIFLYEFRSDGFAGDTWHQTVHQSKNQAACAFGDMVTPWANVPTDVSDAHDFARAAKIRRPTPE